VDWYGNGATRENLLANLAQIASHAGDLVYELMCHPGHFDPNEIQDPSLPAYHAWEQELCVLRSSEFRELCESCCISLIGFRDLPTSSAQQCSAPL
jgi:hypothetical protein